MYTMATTSTSGALLLNHLLLLLLPPLLLCWLASASPWGGAYTLCVANVSQSAAARNPHGTTGTGTRYPCADPRSLSGADFKFSGLQRRGDTRNGFNASSTPGLVPHWPALHTLGVGVARLDLAPGGVVPPHTHPGATEVLFVLQGEVRAGFVGPDHAVYAATVRAGEAFVVPRGMLHYQHNPSGGAPAAAVSFVDAEEPGVQVLPMALFAAGIEPEVVAKSVFISEREAVLQAGIVRDGYRDGLRALQFFE